MGTISYSVYSFLMSKYSLLTLLLFAFYSKSTNFFCDLVSEGHLDNEIYDVVI